MKGEKKGSRVIKVKSIFIHERVPLQRE